MMSSTGSVALERLNTSAPGIRGSVFLQVLVVPLMAAVCLPLAVRVDDPWVAFVTVAIVLVCTAGAAAACGDGARPMSLLFWVFMGTWIGIGSLYQLAVDQMPWHDEWLLRNTNRVLAAQALTLVALLAFAFGTRLTRRTRPSRHRWVGELDIRRALLVAGGCFMLGAAMFPQVTAAAGGLSGLFTTRANRAAVLEHGAAIQPDNAADGFLRILPAALALATAFIALTVVLELRRHRIPGSGLRVAAAIAAGGVLLMALYSNPLTSSRFISVSGLGALVMIATHPRSRRAGLVLGATAVVGLLLVYPLAYGFRADPQTTDLSTSRWDALASNDFDGFQQVANTLQFVEEHGHAWGAHLVSAALYALPRSVWTEKARPASLDVAENRGYEFIDLSLPVHAELYLDLGLGGMILLMIGLGAAWTRLDNAWLAGRPGPATFLVPYLCLAQLGVLRGPLGSLIPVAATTTLLLLLGLGWRGLARAAPTRADG